MKIIFFSILLLAMGVFSNTKAMAQEKTMTLDAKTSLMLPEFEALIVEKDGEVKVMLRFGKDTSKGGDHLEKGDLILMINGVRVKDLANLKEVYGALEKGEQIKMGVRRGESRFIVSAIKGDKSESKSGAIKSISMSKSGGTKSMSMSFQTDGDEKVTFITELGLLLTDVEKLVKVDGFIDRLAPEELKAKNLEDWSLIKINEKKPATGEEAKALIDAVKAGEDLELTFEKDGEEETIILKKPEANNRIRFKSGN